MLPDPLNHPQSFKFLKDWAEDVAYEIYVNETTLPFHRFYAKKIQSIILESMSPVNGWKNGK